MGLKLQPKFIVKEGTTVNEVMQNGSKGQKLCAKMFDADDNGVYEGNEVTLFNSCNITYTASKPNSYEIKPPSVTIYDREVQQRGNGGVIKIFARPGEHYTDFVEHYNYKYQSDNDGNRKLSRTYYDEWNYENVERSYFTNTQKRYDNDKEISPENNDGFVYSYGQVIINDHGNMGISHVNGKIEPKKSSFITNIMNYVQNK